MKTKILLILVISLLVLGGYLVFNKIYYQSLPQLLQIKEQILAPEPLTGPKRATKAEKLLADSIIKWTNYYREENGLPPLTSNTLLKNAAERKSQDMLDRQYFAHTSPTGDYGADELVKSQGYQYKVVGENLAKGDFENEKELVDAWMQSPGHRENILSPDFKEIGVSSKLGLFEGHLTWVSVQIFAAKAPQCPYPSSALLQKIENGKKILNQAESLYEQGSNLINQGNIKIQQGNEIYQKTQDTQQAQPYWDEGEKLQRDGKAKIEEANKLKLQVGDLPFLINQYNRQVQEYNSCISR